MRTRMILAIGLGSVALVGAAAADGSVIGSNGNELPGDSSVPFWPHETGALVGTSETFLDMRADGSYVDPSLGRRVWR